MSLVMVEVGLVEGQPLPRIKYAASHPAVAPVVI